MLQYNLYHVNGSYFLLLTLISINFAEASSNFVAIFPYSYSCT